MRSRIDNAARLFDRLLLVLIEHLIESAWVEKEVETAFDKEACTNTPVLFPVCLDETVIKNGASLGRRYPSQMEYRGFTPWGLMS